MGTARRAASPRDRPEGHREVGRCCSRGATPARSRACRWRAWQKGARTARRHPADAARARRRSFARSTRTRVDDYDSFKEAMEGRPGFVIAPWCGSADCEAQIKTDTQATIRNMPLDGAAPEGRKCVRCEVPRSPRPGSRRRTSQRRHCRIRAGDARCDVPGEIEDPRSPSQRLSRRPPAGPPMRSSASGSGAR